MSEPTDSTSKPPTTTAEQDKRTHGQRRINLIWEITQAVVALTIVIANVVYVFTLLGIAELSIHASAGQALLSNAFFLVIGFYFGRTNHARIGDVPRNGDLDDR